MARDALSKVSTRKTVRPRTQRDALADALARSRGMKPMTQRLKDARELVRSLHDQPKAPPWNETWDAIKVHDAALLAAL